MKKILFLSVFLLGLFSATSQNYYMTSPEGYGAATTGGGNAGVTTVTTYADFKAAIKLVPARIILVSGTLNATYYSEKVVNKTIIGLPGAKLVNTDQTQAGSGILNLKPGSNNVIIRNLIFEGPGAYDTGGRDNLGAEDATNIWVDHCEFQDGIDGNFDIKGISDNITVSWCKFTYLKTPKPDGSGGTDDHRFSNIIGSNKTEAPADNHFSVTFQNCYWAEGCRERMPRARNAELHILNCYYNTSAATGALALGIGGGAKNSSCYVENSDFAKVGNTANKNIYELYTEDGGTVAVKFDGCIKGATSTPVSGLDAGTAAKPTYSYTVMPVADVATYVPNASCGAGATLQVSATGVISTNCPNLGVDDHTLNSVKLYPTIVNDILNIELSDSISGDATIDIYSIAGAKVFSSTKKNLTPNEKVSVNIAGLTRGVYFCKLQIDETATTLKFVKE